MTVRLLPALVSAAALTLVGVTLPAGTAAAGSCAPTIDPATVSYTPELLVLEAKGKYAKKHQQAAAGVTAPCANADGTDLQVEVILSPPDSLEALGVTDDDAAYPSEGPHEYGISTEYATSAKKLDNADAGTWTTELVVTDTDGDSAHDYDAVDGPSIRVLRASDVTSTVSKTSVTLGKSVSVAGTLTRADWDKGKDVAYKKQPVQLQFRPDGGSWATFAAATSSSKGKVKVTVTPSSDGDYRFVFAGSSTTDTTASKARHVHVK